jgi:hypothetical protein
MLGYIIDYGKKFSTDEKLNDYTRKILRGIQRVRRILFPSQINDKLNPYETI